MGNGMIRKTYQEKKIIKLQRRNVKMKLSELIDSNLGQALAILGSKEIGGKAAFKLAQIIAERKKHCLDFEAARKTIIDRFSVKEEDGTNKLTEDKTQVVLTDNEAFGKEMDALVAEEVEMPKIDQSVIENLPEITAHHIAAILPLIKV